jgi:hypothetical protein
MRQPGIEPGSTAWKAAMLTTIPLTLVFQNWPETLRLIDYNLISDFLQQLSKKSLP